MIVTMKKQLRSWQVKNFDSGLLPEAEMAKRAADNKITIYDLAMNPKLYPLERYLEVSEIALSKDINQGEVLKKMLSDADSGVRYWGIVGLFLLKNDALAYKDDMRKAMADSSHEVAAMAAWALFNFGEQEPARKKLKALLASDSYAALKIVNIIDWMGEGFTYYASVLKGAKTSVNQSYLDRVKITAGVASEKKKVAKKNKKKK